MDMQDKEFDELFRSKLDGYEEGPSAKVWNNIAGKLNVPKRRKVLTPFLSIAASIIVLIGAGLLFIPKKPPLKTKQSKVAKIILPVTIKQGRVTPQIAKMVPDTTSGVIIARHQGSTHRTNVNNRFMAINIDTLPTHPPLIKRQNQQFISSASQMQAFDSKTIVPVVIAPVIEQLSADNQPEIAALESSQKDTPAVKIKPGIHNLGGLVNALIAKVDKRKDKVIEFSDNEDGESKLTGINLGIIKIKKER